MKLKSGRDNRISQITTRWTEIFDAHDVREQAPDASEAQHAVLARYGSCIYHYLLGATRNPDTADELAQEFAYRFIRGDLSRANPQRGRFRDYLRVSLRNLVNDFYRRRAKAPREHFDEQKDPVKDFPVDDLDMQFRESWRREIVQLTWQALESYEQQKQNGYFSILKFRARNPDLNSDEMAEEISEQWKTPVNAAWVRQKLHRARKKFGNLLIEEVRKTISQEDPDQLNEELADLQLLEYLPVSCR